MPAGGRIVPREVIARFGRDLMEVGLLTPQAIEELDLRDDRRFLARPRGSRPITGEKRQFEACLLRYMQLEGRWGPVVTERALGLLWDHLDGRQRYELANTDGFRVVGSDSRPYRVGMDGIVSDVGERQQCISPAADLPGPDRALAQKLWLETDAEIWNAVANSDLRTDMLVRQDGRLRISNAGFRYATFQLGDVELRNGEVIAFDASRIEVTGHALRAMEEAFINGEARPCECEGCVRMRWTTE